MDAGDELHVAAVLLVVAQDEGGPALQDRIDAVLLRELHGLEDLLLGHVGAEQGADVVQVPRVHAAGNQVASQQQTADLGLAQHPVRQGIRRFCRCGRRGRFCPSARTRPRRAAARTAPVAPRVASELPRKLRRSHRSDCDIFHLLLLQFGKSLQLSRAQRAPPINLQSNGGVRFARPHTNQLKPPAAKRRCLEPERLTQISPGQRPGNQAEYSLRALKGRNNLPRNNKLYRPFRACGHLRTSVPRALPWANLYQPFGL